MAFEITGPTGNADRTGAAYARFSRRLRALFIDWIFFLLVLVSALAIAVAVESDSFSRKLGYAVAAALLLYEPLLVCLTGSSIGHYFSNLRVVDNRTNGNVSFLKAVARVVIKGVLGWYSFITMATTRRHQAVHDLLTQSSVQIRDPAKASPHHYVRERIELLNPAMPSRIRRAMVIVVYLVPLLALVWLVLNGLIFSGIVSRACVFRDRCLPSENILVSIVVLAWFALSVLMVIQGWRGRLAGCRIRRVT